MSDLLFIEDFFSKKFTGGNLKLFTEFLIFLFVVNGSIGCFSLEIFSVEYCDSSSSL